MHCKRARAQIHDWLDANGQEAPGTPLREHLRDCDGCRAFVRQWNSVELALQGERDRLPEARRDFGPAVRALVAERQVTMARARISYARLALAGAGVLLVLLLARFLGPLRIEPGNSTAGLAATGRALPANQSPAGR